MGTINYTTLRPFSSIHNELPRLVKPNTEANGIIEGKTFQYQPSDSPKYWQNGGNLRDYTHDEALYTVNEYGFRGNEIVQKDSILMTAGCSHTYGIGVRDNEVWGNKLAEDLGMYHINIGVGGIGCDTVVLLIKQFFEENIIPDTLVVLWPTLTRKLLVSDKTTSLDDEINNFFIQPNAKSTSNVYQFTVGNSLPEQEDLKSAVKGYLLQSMQQNLLDFWMHREIVIALCSKHNVKLIEGFLEADTLNYVKQKCNKKIPRKEFYIGNNTNTDPWDWARDNMHFGPKAHTNIAKWFSIEYKESYV